MIGRETNGYFARGNTIAKGNAVARRMQAHRATLLAAVTPEQIERVWAALVAMAESGDVAAARVFLAYAVGKPAENVKLDVRTNAKPYVYIERCAKHPDSIRQAIEQARAIEVEGREIEESEGRVEQ